MRGAARQHRRASRYVQHCAGIVLPQWRITLSVHPPEDAPAEISVDTELRVAEMFLGPEFYEGTEDYQRELVGHELVHCPLATLEQPLEDLEDWLKSQQGMLGMFGPPTMPLSTVQILRTSYKRLEETCVQVLTTSIVRALPLPGEIK